MKKTAKQWLMGLKDEHRNMAIANMEEGAENDEYSCLSMALSMSCHVWRNTPQGYDFWREIFEQISSGTYFDAPQLTEESCGEAARKTMYGIPKRMATDEDYENLDEIAPESICQEAQRIQGGDRQQDYGSPTKNFQDIADLWSTYIKTSLDVDVDLKARDVAHMSILMKISRNVHKPKRDNWVDMAGYAQCGGKVDEL